MSIQNAIKVASGFLDAQQEFWLPALSDKAEKVAEAHPHDSTCVGMAQILSKRASKSNTITRGELVNFYQQIGSSGSRFPQYFESELKLEKQAQAKPLEFKEQLAPAEVDPVYLQAFASIFDKKATYQPSEASKKEAIAATRIILRNLVTPARSIEVVTASPEWMICRAGFETPKGETAVLIPVEVHNKEVLFPNKFAHVAGWAELTTENLRGHLKSAAGKHLEVKADQLLSSLTKKAEAPLNEVELAIVKAKLSKFASSDLSVTGIQYKEPFLFEKKAAIKDPESPEVQKFADQLATNAGTAALLFSKATVDKGRDLVTRSLLNLGYSAQVGVADSGKDVIFYGVSIANQGFKVPIKIANGLPCPPKFASMNGELVEFTSAGITELLNSGSDLSAHAAASSFGSAGETGTIIGFKEALETQNWEKAEDALAVLANGEIGLYRIAFQAYQEVLSGKISKTASTKCASPRKDKNHVGEICGHTGLPMNKVYQDQYGMCHPMHRQGREHATGEQMSMVSKIVMGG